VAGGRGDCRDCGYAPASRRGRGFYSKVPLAGALTSGSPQPHSTDLLDHGVGARALVSLHPWYQAPPDVEPFSEVAGVTLGMRASDLLKARTATVPAAYVGYEETVAGYQVLYHFAGASHFTQESQRPAPGAKLVEIWAGNHSRRARRRRTRGGQWLQKQHAHGRRALPAFPYPLWVFSGETGHHLPPRCRHAREL
jgi:hypothetical protein